MSGSGAWKGFLEQLSYKYISLSHHKLLEHLCELLPTKRAGGERLKGVVAIVDVFWLVKQLNFDKESKSYRDQFECQCSLQGSNIVISIGGSTSVTIPRSTATNYLDGAKNSRIVIDYDMPSEGRQSIKGFLNVDFTQTVLHTLSSSAKPLHKEIVEAIEKGINYLKENLRMNGFWSPYPKAQVGGMATCDAISALTYPIVGYDTIDIFQQQRQNNFRNLSEEGIKTFCELIKNKGMWTDDGLLIAGGDLPTQYYDPFVSINADLILCYYAVTKAMEIFGKESEENECLQVLESFKNNRLSKIVNWLLKQQVIASGLWVENNSIDCANRESPIATSFAIRALSLDWRLRQSSAGKAQNEIKSGVDALTKWLENNLNNPDLKLSELAHSLNSIIEASINLGLSIPDIIHKYPSVLLDKVHELLRNLPDRCTEEEKICNYDVTYSTLGPALLALVKCYEVFSTMPSPSEGEKRVMMKLVKPRLRYYADILARVGCEILKKRGYMAERRGEVFQPATSATASLIIALIEYDAKMNVHA